MLSVRSIPNIPVERARLRSTLAYRITPRLQAGLEWNPLAEDVGPIANWRVWDEDAARPALILGTSSDRIGTDHGRSFYASLSKDLEPWTGLAVSPYAGLAYGEFDSEWVAIGGLVVRWSERWTSYHMWDGHNLHHVLETTLNERSSMGLVLAHVDGGNFLGLSFSTSFGRHTQP